MKFWRASVLLLVAAFLLMACDNNTAAPAANTPMAAAVATNTTKAAPAAATNTTVAAAPAAATDTPAAAAAAPKPTNTMGALPTPNSASGVTTLWFHSGTGGEREALDASIKKFNASNSGTTIEAVQLPEGSYNDQVNAAALANGLPCLLDFDGPNVYNYAWTGRLVPLDSYVTADMKADFLPSIIRQGTYSNKLYSLGQFDSGLGIYGNKDLLTKAGVRIPTGVSDAWSSDEFNDALKKLKASGLDYPLDMKMDYGRGEWYTYGFSPILQSFGGDLIDRSNYQKADGTINSAASVKAMTWFQGLFKDGYVNRKPAGGTDFADGKAALSYVGHWTYADYKKALGDKLVVLPMPKFGGKAVTGQGSWNWGITSTCKDPAAAWKVMNFLLSDEEILRMTDANGAPPARKSALSQSKLYGPGAPLQVFADQLNNSLSLERPVTPAYPAITAAFQEATDNIVNGADVKGALDKAAKKIDQDIQDNQGYPIK